MVVCVKKHFCSKCLDKNTVVVVIFFFLEGGTYMLFKRNFFVTHITSLLFIIPETFYFFLWRVVYRISGMQACVYYSSKYENV